MQHRNYGFYKVLVNLIEGESKTVDLNQTIGSWSAPLSFDWWDTKKAVNIDMLYLVHGGLWVGRVSSSEYKEINWNDALNAIKDYFGSDEYKIASEIYWKTR